MDNSNSEPIIVLDITRHRIRIHRSTMNRLGSPEYVLLLINPDNKGIVVESCEETTKGAHHLLQTAKRHSTEVYSPSLIGEIYSCAGFDNANPVTLVGRQIRGRDAVFFPLEANKEAGNTMEAKDHE